MLKITDVIGRRMAIAGLAGAALFSLATAASAFDVSSSVFRSIFVRTEPAAITINESNGLVAVPGMTIGAFIVPAGQNELFVVSFSASVELQNASSSVITFNADDVLDVQMQAVNNGTGAVIILNPTSVLSFASGNSPGAHSMTWARRIPTGSWSFRLMGRVNDRPQAAVVRALISARTMTISRFD